MVIFCPRVQLVWITLKGFFSQPIIFEYSQGRSFQLFIHVVAHSKQFSANLSFYPRVI